MDDPLWVIIVPSGVNNSSVFTTARPWPIPPKPSTPIWDCMHPNKGRILNIQCFGWDRLWYTLYFILKTLLFSFRLIWVILRMWAIFVNFENFATWGQFFWNLSNFCEFLNFMNSWNDSEVMMNWRTFELMNWRTEKLTNWKTSKLTNWWSDDELVK